MENQNGLLGIEPADPPEIRQSRGTQSSEGYTIFSPMATTTTYLIDNSGTVVHTWPSIYYPSYSVYLLEDGSILRPVDAEVDTFGGSGCVQLISYNGTVIWEFYHYGNDYSTHHDVEILPNGNVLMIAWERKYASEAIAAGRDPNLLDQNELWPEYIIEVEPTGPITGNIVWEWHFWDHMIQDFDPIKNNYGVVEDHPELLDINYVRNPNNALADWLHFNSIDYNPELDQILVSARHTDEIYIIDHSTTTAEAAGHSGGKSGKGGDILYRWGNPRTYRAGNTNDRKLFNQHDAQWIEPGCPGEGNILIFNNGWQRPGGWYSSIDEIEPPVDEYGNYSIIPGGRYEPETPTWIYKAENPSDFYSSYISGCQRLLNGDTLICDGPGGHFFEVTPNNTTVWEYMNPYPEISNNAVFKVRRYAPDYPGLMVLLPHLRLSEGWNLISIPNIQLDQDLSFVLGTIEGLYDAVQWYDSTDLDDPWKHHKVGKTFGNDLYNLNETRGFWIHISEPGGTTFIYRGTEPNSSCIIPLYPGWNLVGFPSLSDKDRTTGLNNLLYGTDINSIWAFDAASQTWDEIDEMDSFVVGKGYWVHAINECTWIVPL